MSETIEAKVINDRIEDKSSSNNNNFNRPSGMSNGLKILIGVGVFILLIVMYAINVHNSLVGLDEQVKASWSRVENDYKRRSDLIQTLVGVTKGYAKHEKETLEGVINARAKATSINIDISKATEEDIKRFNQAQSGLSSALSRLMAVSEKYPDLKANQNFLSLQSQIEGTENRIAVARKDYIDLVAKYNSIVRKFPTNIFAGMMGLGTKPTFSISEEEAKVPKISF